MLWTVIALICILIGILQAAFKETLLFPSVAWFVLAIAFNTLGAVPLPWKKQG